MINSVLTLFAASGTCPSKGFFGLKPWYHYINDSAHFADRNPGDGVAKACDIVKFKLFPPNSDVPLVLLAVIDDLLRIAAFVALGFLFVGAIQYITSQGQPEDAAKAQSTIINSLIGLAVAIVAVAFVSFLGNRLGG